MAKKSMIARDKKRAILVTKYSVQRVELRAQVKDIALSEVERMEAQIALQKLPRDSSPSRMRNRCRLTGRPRGYYRKFGLARNKLRDLMMRGEVPGVVKASW
ncbi:MAG: 30S ribosomal protein S14 [Gammaproteobacteria bacterium]|jgi:small subunit ribosomal protein S14|nr:30S ribosomal protein S14 [Gammaproteobacteria bacterium]